MTDLLAIHQEDHLLLDRGSPWITKMTESKTMYRKDDHRYCNVRRTSTSHRERKWGKTLSILLQVLGCLPTGRTGLTESKSVSQYVSFVLTKLGS